MQYLLETSDGNRRSLTEQQYELLRHRNDVMHIINTPSVRVICSREHGPKSAPRSYSMGGGRRMRQPYEELSAYRHVREQRQ